MKSDGDNWQPTYADFDERKVIMDIDVLSLSRSGREITLTLQVSTQPDYMGNGAIFWIDVKHVYLRYSWDTWYEVPQDNLDILKELARRHAITLSLFKNNEFKSYPIRIFHVDRLPEHLFDEKDASPADDPIAPDPPEEPEPQALHFMDFSMQVDSATSSSTEEAHTPDDMCLAEGADGLAIGCGKAPVAYEYAVKNYHAFSRMLASMCNLPDDIPASYDEFLQKASKAAWEKMRAPFKEELERLKVDYFSEVKLNGGWADDAFSNEDTALLVQVYRGEKHLQRQIRELAAVAEDLQKSDPGNVVLTGIVFAESLPAPSLPPSVERITPEFLRDFASLFTSETDSA